MISPSLFNLLSCSIYQENSFRKLLVNISSSFSFQIILFIYANWMGSSKVLWQPLITKTNDYTSGKSLSWISSRKFTRELNKKSAKLESYIYKVHMVYATNNYTCPHVYATSLYSSYFLLKAIMLYTCALTLSSRSFYYILGL